jgi:hypothetical protein
MVFGLDNLLGRAVLEPLVRPRVFGDDLARAWLRHNVEEVGNLENFLPHLYAPHHPGPPIPTRADTPF